MDADLDLRHVTPAFRTFCGAGALRALPRELDRVGARRAVIVCGPSLSRQAGTVQRLTDVLGDRLAALFAEVRAHSPLPSVLAARDALATHDADAIVAVGGGSAVVTARAAAVLLAEQAGVHDLCTRRAADGRLISPRLSAPKLPQWVVATTPTTAYAKAGAAVRDPVTGERLALYDPKARAQGVILDPAMALTAPAELTWSAALNVFAMAVEGLTSRTADPLADALLSHALRTVVTWLPGTRTQPGQAQPRLHLMLAALMAGQGSDATGGGLAQALSHAIGPRSSAANGVVEALLLPHALRFAADAIDDRLTAMAGYLGLADHKPDAVIAEIERLLIAFEVPQRLREVDVSAPDLHAAATHAMDDWALSAAPRVPGAEDVHALLNAAW
ncbi:alcohol dehydrogenase class IV [Actinoplanes lutulentus]|uniref:Alcohol dehydrogenase class IV n=1 Tax=Actinoplanes lutulentus TaxID=1287878 RepID=A0A327ZAD4_9ACTN|nr:iron-containing alcohol dehydrogenase family protein [Actinoplanes lutulentus]MBB2946342.1 alcohol dehydrogenase class IV [Actinoplanes lutulentus]RAK28719.1 alcohol dehydrogenase class IV [Actinoplanes lutulentus]